MACSCMTAIAAVNAMNVDTLPLNKGIGKPIPLGLL